jgi:3D (Asp-Asp-Asp) domain-containing protein
MKKIVANVLVISSQLLIGALFLVLLYSNNMEKSKVVVIENNNLNKTSDVVSNLFMKENSSTPIETSKSDNKEKEEVVVELKSSEVVTPAPAVVEEPEVVVPPVYQYVSLYTYMGMTLTGYGPNCYGCSGYTSTGHDAHNIYYSDSEYGAVRVVAADKSISFCTIVRISNIPNMDPVIAIVLDRGSDVGFADHQSTNMDLLAANESEAIHKTSGVNIDILRYGDGKSCLE